MKIKEKKKGLLAGGLFDRPFMDSKATTNSVSTKEWVLGHLVGPLGLIFVVNTIAALVEKFFTQQTGAMYGVGNVEMIMKMGGWYEIIMTTAKILGVGVGLLNGWLIQKTESRQGRMRPWHLIFGFVSIIIGCLIFLFPGNHMGNIYWFYFFFLVICYHTIGSSYFYLFRDTICSLVTRDPKEKAFIQYIRKMSWTLISGIIIGMMISMVVLPLWLEKDIKGYPILMICLSVAAIPLLLLEYYYTRERITEDVAAEYTRLDQQKVPLRDQLKALLSNKYFVILIIIATVGGIVDNYKGGNVQYFYIKFLLGGAENPMMYTIYQVVTGSMTGIGAFIVYPLAKKVGIKNLTVGGYAIVLAGSILGMLFPDHMVLALVAGFLRQVGMLPNAYIFAALMCYAYLKMIGVDPTEEKTQIAKKVEEFEKEAKRKFVDEPANMKLLIVVDKLLTGFDAPSCTYLYIDKAMRDHGLFQAICRVNRLDGESKEFGYIVDYKELFGDLADAVNKYTAGAFEAYDEEDVEGLLKDRTIEAKKNFESILEELDELCEGVEYPRGKLEHQHYFCGESGQDEDKDEAFARLREKLYKLVGRLVRAFAELKPRMNDAGYSTSEQTKLDERVSFYIALRDEIGRASGDFIDLKAYEPGMRYLIDNYIAAEDSQKIGMLDDFTLLDFVLSQEGKLDNEDDTAGQESAAESIENNIRKKVVERMTINPAYYARMSAILEQLIIDRKKGVIKYAELLDAYVALAKNATKPEDNTHYPESVRSHGGLRALYDNCGEDEAYALKLHKAIMKAKQDGFRNNPAKENRIKRALYQIVNDDDEVERIYHIVVEQEEY